ncbi:right-handed parallel beta-helix repeat-containing protein [Haloferula sp. A504]|uniref:right-handed parallel beta-helix repeat-containing protein n=1 Tax=Haloferula sp. A504 TaxID=3373601 RepID=UPI0031C9288D|nr:right-handed parallel beta-helix repeat-containing protein [Verrucomicrobiaceae bacterium E54]
MNGHAFLASSAGDDEIWVAAGTYTPDPGGTDQGKKFQLASGVAIYGGFAGTESTLGDRNPDPATNGTVLSGDLQGDDGANFANRSDNSARVVDGTAVDTTAILDGFTIRGGEAPASGGGFGGNGSPTVTGCRFHDNRAGNRGGAVALLPGSAAAFVDCQFIDNEAGSDGGAVDADTSDSRFVGCIFEGNLSGSLGGAVNSADSTNVFSHCSFRGNRVIPVDFFASGNGGALHIRGSEIHIIHNCEFSGNRAVVGGALYILTSSPVLTNVTISGNHASDLGGGVCMGLSAAAPSFTNCIIWNNSAGSPTPLVASIAKGGGSPSFSHCIVQHSGGSLIWNPNTGSNGGGNLDLDPGFTTPLDPLTAPSTAGDFTLGAASPAINAGLDTADLDGAGGGSDTIATVAEDLAGQPRLSGSAVDIGAYETFEEPTGTTFVSLFPNLDPADDDNHNGLSNFLDYALGANPTAPHDPDVMPSIVPGTLTFGHRADAEDVDPVYKKSSTLGGWTTMQPGIDYDIISSQTAGGRVVVTLELLLDPVANPRMFFIQEFPEP